MIYLEKINQFNLDKKKSLSGMLEVIPTSNEPIEKTNNENIKEFLKPYLSHNFPANGITIVNPNK